MNLIKRSLILFLMGGWALAADPPATVASATPDPTASPSVPMKNVAPVAPSASAPETASPGPVDVMAEALPVLQSKYVDFPSLQFKDGDHLSDLVARSNGRISLTPSDTVPAKAATVITDTLPGNVIYWRLGSFKPEKSWSDLAAQLQKAESLSSGAVLDLRSNSAPDDYLGAAHLLKLFELDDRRLARYVTDEATIKVTGHSFDLPIVVLVNGQTTGAAEALAACLKNDGALIVGRPTAGRAAVFGSETFSDGEVLRYVTSDVSLDGAASLWGHPVAPDIALKINDHDEKGALILIRDHHVLDVIGESPERHLLNEASLIKGVDPEWDEYLESLEKKPVLLSLPEIHDKALISALDSLKAIQVSQHRPPAGNGPQPSTSVQ